MRTHQGRAGAPIRRLRPRGRSAASRSSRFSRASPRAASAAAFATKPVSAALIETLAALALSAPTKSDLQQRDILIVDDPAIRDRIDTLLADQDWIPKAPHFLVFLGNNRRQRQIHDWTGIPFANDHLDAFFNAVGRCRHRASAFVLAAEAAGLGCCPVSVIRNHAEEVSGMLGLPDHVFPVAGLGFGWPSAPSYISSRLPLSATVHRNRYTDATARLSRATIAGATAYSLTAASAMSPASATSPTYGWSEDKARQYAEPERADFGKFVNARGFKLT